MANKANPIDVEQFLSTERFPSDKSSLVTSAREKHASPEILTALDSLPERQYQNAADAAKATYSEPYRMPERYGADSCED